MFELKCTDLQQESLGHKRWPPAKISQGCPFRSTTEGGSTLGSSISENLNLIRVMLVRFTEFSVVVDVDAEHPSSYLLVTVF